MKTPMLSLLVGGLLLPQLFAGPQSSTPRLAGIVNLPDQKAALLDFSLCDSTPLSLVLRERQRVGELCEIIRIDPMTGTVELRLGWTNTTVMARLPRHGDPIATAAGSLELAEASLDLVLNLYAECKGRSLLRSPRLPATSFTLDASATNQAQAALVLEKALAEKGIATLPDGEKFLMVVAESETATVKPRSSEVKSAAATGGGTELIPPGAITFASATLNQVAHIYAEFIGRKLESNPRSTLPDGLIKFQNVTPLNKEECVYALETLLSWQGVKVIPVAQGLARLVPVSESTPVPGK